MPLPTPGKDEKEQEFMARCMSFVTEENKGKPKEERKPHAQLIAMCMSQFGHKAQQRKITLHAHFASKMLGNAILIEGSLLRPGVFTGLDGVPTKYTEDFIHNVKIDIQGKPIKFAHAISPDSMSSAIPQGAGVGYWTGWKRNGELKVRGYVFDQRAIAYVKRHPNVGLSMEADVATHADADGLDLASGGTLTGGVLIDDPACPACKVEHAREVNLQSEERLEKVEDTMSATQSTATEDFLTFDPKAQPTRESFFTWFGTQLVNAKVPENVKTKVMEIVKKAVTTPYPYPLPSSAKVLEAEMGKELAAGVLILMSEYTDFMAQCQKSGKSMQECALEFKKKGPPAEGAEMQHSKPEDPKLAERLAAAEGQLKAIEQERKAQATKELEAMVAEIKKFDETFASEKFLEGIACPDVQRKMLGSYLEVMKKNKKPIRLQVSQQEGETAVKETVKEMFGEGVTFESLFDTKPEE